MSDLCIFSVACQKFGTFYGIVLLGIGWQWAGIGNSLKYVPSVDSSLISIAALLWATLVTFTYFDGCEKSIIAESDSDEIGNICVSFTVKYRAPNSQGKIGEFSSCWSAKCPFLLASRLEPDCLIAV